MLSLLNIKISNHDLTQTPNQAIKSYFSRFSFLILTQHLSVSHGLSTLDGKENDDGDFEKTKI
jgi:hypothetical protein